MGFPRQRRSGIRCYNKVFFVVAEGAVTENTYMEHVGSMAAEGCRVNVIRRRKASRCAVQDLQKEAEKHARELRNGDELWILLDRDEACHTPEQLATLGRWAEAQEGAFFIAISNPRFEYWLLQHFEPSPSLAAAMNDRALERYLPGYADRKDISRYTLLLPRERIVAALEHAHRRNAWPDCQQPDIIGSAAALLVARVLGWKPAGR